MSFASESFLAGHLETAIAAAIAELRDDPGNLGTRRLLFALFCFAGDYDRAERQLAVLLRTGEARLGAEPRLYQAALAAERTRQRTYAEGAPPVHAPAGAARGSMNGRPFDTLEDLDPRVGPVLEVLAADRYLQIPFTHLARLRAEPLAIPLDHFWRPAELSVRPDGWGEPLSLGRVLLPVLAPLSWRDPSEAVRLGRETQWRELDGQEEVPLGQKLLSTGSDDLPILELDGIETSDPNPL